MLKLFLDKFVFATKLLAPWGFFALFLSLSDKCQVSLYPSNLKDPVVLGATLGTTVSDEGGEYSEKAPPPMEEVAFELRPEWSERVNNHTAGVECWDLKETGVQVWDRW